MIKEFQIGSGKSLFSLALDKALFEFVAYLSRRASLDRHWAGPLCASTTDLITHRLIATGSFERLQIEALDQLLENPHFIPGLNVNRNGLFIDVGANIGLFTIRYANLFDKLLAIEANPITYHLLQANLELRRTQNVISVCAGASNSEMEGSINVDAHGMLGWSSVEETDLLSNRETYKVKTQLMRLDEMIKESCADSPVAVIKIDIEGHERIALDGATETLEKHKPLVLYEKNAVETEDTCAELLRRFGYNRFFIFKRRKSFFGLGGTSALVAREVDPDASGPAALMLAFVEAKRSPQ